MNGGLVRKAVFAGSWYPGDPAALKNAIYNYLADVPLEDKVEADVIGLVAPHAGYMYSGRVAAFAYSCLAGRRYDSVVVIGPSHRVPFHGVSILESGGYESPLGAANIDEEMCAAISAQSDLVKHFPQAHRQEHSIEIQLPFIQLLLPGVPFVPLIMGDQSLETCCSLAGAIARAALGKRALVVASSDLSHFHDSARAAKMDGMITGRLAAMDQEGLLKLLAQGSAEACGGGPMAVTMTAAKLLGAERAQLLCYADSGDINGDKSKVVGYAAAVFFRE